jgi:hypothetical protein
MVERLRTMSAFRGYRGGYALTVLASVYVRPDGVRVLEPGVPKQEEGGSEMIHTVASEF